MGLENGVDAGIWREQGEKKDEVGERGEGERLKVGRSAIWTLARRLTVGAGH